ncbi:hypothetical protein [Alkaliphilus transvaalensis]|uniref:hypothetical protein n=1 Tax=Alkaliphilus transvaalensis TaxID=114628 RepID=UPI000479DF08|nr:hypothetical protein [Alkaliphilus transvaalensis]
MKKLSFATALFALGFLFGLVFMTLFQMHTFDRLYRVQNQLTNQLLDREIKLERLNESIKNQSTFLVKDLKINIKFDGNILIRDEIEKYIQFYLSDLVGKELDNIDGEMIYKILEDRIINVDDKKIQLTVKSLIISQEISIVVEAKIIE